MRFWAQLNAAKIVSLPRKERAMCTVVLELWYTPKEDEISVELLCGGVSVGPPMWWSGGLTPLKAADMSSEW